MCTNAHCLYAHPLNSFLTLPSFRLQSTLRTLTHTLIIDKLDAVGMFRKRRRLQSEEEGLSLTEYLRGKQEVDSGPAGKRVRIGL